MDKPATPTTALVLGGYGAVGACVVAELRARGVSALAAGRDPGRADRVVDLRDGDSYRRGLSGVDIVVNASGLEDENLAVIAAAHGAAFVDVSATTGYLARLEALDPAAPVLVSVGLAPGLTNLLAAAVHAETRGPVDLAVLLGAGERHGAASTAWAYGLIGKRFTGAGGDTVRNYTRPRVFELPGYGRRRLYRVDFSDQHTLSRDLGVPVRTYFGLDSRAATAALTVLTRIPGGAKAPRGLHLPGTDRWLVLARGADGTTRHTHGRNQSNATAIVAAVAVPAARRLSPGVHHLHRVLTLADLPPSLLGK